MHSSLYAISHGDDVVADELDGSWPFVGARTLIVDARRLKEASSDGGDAIVVTIDDVTAQRRAEATVRYHSQLLDSLEHSVFSLDARYTSREDGHARR